MPRDPTGASRQRQLLRISQKLAHAEPETALGILQRCDQTPDVMLRTAAILLSEARSDGWLRAARRICARRRARHPPTSRDRVERGSARSSCSRCCSRSGRRRSGARTRRCAPPRSSAALGGDREELPARGRAPARSARRRARTAARARERRRARDRRRAAVASCPQSAARVRGGRPVLARAQVRVRRVALLLVRDAARRRSAVRARPRRHRATCASAPAAGGAAWRRPAHAACRAACRPHSAATSSTSRDAEGAAGARPDREHGALPRASGAGGPTLVTEPNMGDAAANGTAGPSSRAPTCHLAHVRGPPAPRRHARPTAFDARSVRASRRGRVDDRDRPAPHILHANARAPRGGSAVRGLARRRGGG